MIMDTTSGMTENKAFQKSGAAASIGMALCYVSMFIVYGAILSLPQTDDIGVKLQYIADHYYLISVADAVGYLLFGCLLLITVQAVHRHLLRYLPVGFSGLLNSAGAFGFIWVVLMMCSGFVALIGLDKILELHADASPHAVPLFYSYGIVVNALGGGIELVGGLWVLLLSIVAIRDGGLPKWLNVLGVGVGLAGIFTLFHGVGGLKEAFGLGQIVWFVGLGIALFRRMPSQRQ